MPDDKSCARGSKSFPITIRLSFDEMPKFGLGKFHQQLPGEPRSLGGRFKAQLDALVGFQEIGGG
jgi:hypothetical protein